MTVGNRTPSVHYCKNNWADDAGISSNQSNGQPEAQGFLEPAANIYIVYLIINITYSLCDSSL
jgi:hypothetical protein